jgi:transglutaminase-like putative cysteine protease
MTTSPETKPPVAQPSPRTYEITHRTEYTYAEPVTASYGWAYLTPRDAPGQRCTASDLVLVPPAGRLDAVRDIHGNRATYFEVLEAHRRLVVTATSRVEVTRSRPPASELAVLNTLTWEQARDLIRADPELSVNAADFTLPSPRLPLTSALTRFAATHLPAGAPLGETLLGLIHAIHDDFTYASGATTVSSTLDDVLTRREGVCQDFAHLAVATLRRAGLPARYVSGYLETFPPPGQPKLQGADASHAWVSVLVPTLGWLDLDPTNDQLIGPDYVVTSWGRDYSDVPPLKGVIFTEGASSTLRVAVDVLRL